MAAREETDRLWEKMKELAVEQQQCFYEFLPDCTMYESKEHKYLKQNIGFAIYGPPTDKKETNTNTTTSNSCHWKSETPDANADVDVADLIEYDKEATEVISDIYNKMCESDPSKPIYYGIIYNIIFRPKKESPMKEKSKKKEVKEEDMISISPNPIFTFRKSIPKKPNKKGTTYEVTSYETWYIDTSGRVYKSWTDYLENNTLPKCTMIFPKDGIYQPDPNYPITEDYSTVWFDIADSPACTLKTAICNGIDTASTIVGLSSLGLCVASAFTPLGPILAATSLAATGASSIWTIGRCSHRLADRKTHEESIHISDKEAFSQWLGIAGTAFGLGAAGGTAAISAAAARNVTINKLAIKMFNVVQTGSIVVNGIGVAYQGYCVIDKYRKGESCKADTLNFLLHVMFFAGSVVKVQFANDIIESTQGKVISDYKDSLTEKRFLKKFRAAARKAAAKSTSKISENVEILKYINNRQQLQTAEFQAVSGNNKSSLRKIVWSFDQGKLKVNGIVLLDPVQFVIRLIKSDELYFEVDRSNSSNSQYDDLVFEKLINLVCDLFVQHYKKTGSCSRNMPDFEPLIKEMSSMRIDEEYFQKLFSIAVKLIRRSNSKEEFLFNAILFIWQYCQANLKQWGIYSLSRKVSDSGSKILQKIIVVVFEAIDEMLDNLSEAFAMYLKAELKQVKW